MKKITSIFWIFLVCVLCVGCTSASSDQSDTTRITYPPLPEEYTLMGAIGESGATDSRFAGLTNGAEYGIGTGSNTIQESDVPQSLKSPYNDGRSFIYQSSRIFYKDQQNAEYDSFYSHYLLYRSSDGTELEYLAGTDLLVGYRKTHSPTGSFPELSDDEIKKISDAFVLQHMSKENFAKFTFDSVERDPVNRYIVHYTRYLYGYPTDETIYVAIEDDGVPETFTALNLCKYDSVLVAKENIDAAKAYLHTQIDAMELADLHYYPTYVITNADGEVYLRQMIAYTGATEKTLSQILYINVN